MIFKMTVHTRMVQSISPPKVLWHFLASETKPEVRNIGYIQGTLSEHTVDIQGTFREH